MRGVTRENDGDDRDDAGMHAPEHRPSPQESGERRKRVAEKNVEAAGLRKDRRQFRAHEGAEQRQCAARRPHEHDLGW
jgi:hypothetical protein